MNKYKILLLIALFPIILFGLHTGYDIENSVGFWSLGQNAANGTTIFDLSGEVNNGTSANSPVFTKNQGGVPNQAMVFNGSSDVVNMGDVNDIATNDFTFSFWIKPTDITTRYIFGKYEDAANRWYFRFGADSSMNFYMRVGDVLKDNMLSANTFESLINTWIYIVIVNDRSSGWAFYVNGSSEALTDDVVTVDDLTNTGDYKVGAYSTLEFAGDMSGFIQYPEAKDQTWITAQYLAGQTTSGIVADGTSLIQGDNSTFDTVGDWTANGATLTGGYNGGSGHSKCLRIEADDGSSDRAQLAIADFTQTIIVDNIYILSFNYKFITAPTVNPTVSVAGASVGTTDKIATTWTNFNESFTAVNNTTQLRIYVATSGGTANDELLIDNVVVTDLTNQTLSTLTENLIYDSPMHTNFVVGGKMIDLTVGANHGTVSNVTIGSEYSTFNGTTSYIDIGTDKPSELTGDITVSCWIYPTGYGGGGFGRIIDNGKLIIYYRDIHKIQGMSDGSTTVNSAVNSITDNTWQHLLITRNSAGDETNYYIDGILSGTANQDSGTPAGGTTNTFIGNNDATTRTFDGNIAQFRIWDKILSTTEIMQEFNRKKATYLP